MNSIYEVPLKEFLEQASSVNPTPGGGCVAAVAGSMAVSMLQMVANLTLGRDQSQEVETTVKEILNVSDTLAQEFQELADEDIQVFGLVMEAYRKPKETAQEIAVRKTALAKALQGATETPLKTARTALHTLQETGKLAPVGNKMVLSDAGVAAQLAEASARSAMLNVRINVQLLADSTYAQQALTEKENIESQLSKEMFAIQNILDRRLAI